MRQLMLATPEAHVSVPPRLLRTLHRADASRLPIRGDPPPSPIDTATTSCRRLRTTPRYRTGSESTLFPSSVGCSFQNAPASLQHICRSSYLLTGFFHNTFGRSGHIR